MRCDDDDYFAIEVCAGATVTVSVAFPSKTTTSSTCSSCCPMAPGWLLSQGANDVETVEYLNDSGGNLTVYARVYGDRTSAPTT
ncbi:MAG: hypothetical protein R3F43_32265 [bacterium]